jgi:hypothetical protein
MATNPTREREREREGENKKSHRAKRGTKNISFIRLVGNIVIKPVQELT